MKKENKLIKKLEEAKKRIDNGEFVTEEEFFKNSPMKKEAKLKEIIKAQQQMIHKLRGMLEVSKNHIDSLGRIIENMGEAVRKYG